MNQYLRLALTPLPLLALTAAAPPPAKPPTPSEIVAQAPPAAWATVPADDLLVMDLDSGQRIVIALAPDFAPVHIANVRLMARTGWVDGLTINRVQDNYVTQWGDVTDKKPLPKGAIETPPAEYERGRKGLAFHAMPYRDAYAKKAGHVGGWPVASDGRNAWLIHCYSMVGVGRGLPPSTGTGAELYTVIGHAPRHLDRNITTIGRVLGGMDALTSLPRGTEALGFYKEGSPRPVIVKARMASDMPAADRPSWQVMTADGPSLRQWVKARANRKDDFFIRPAGAIDICNALPPVRPTPKS